MPRSRRNLTTCQKGMTMQTSKESPAEATLPMNKGEGVLRTRIVRLVQDDQETGHSDNMADVRPILHIILA